MSTFALILIGIYAVSIIAAIAIIIVLIVKRRKKKGKEDFEVRDN